MDGSGDIYKSIARTQGGISEDEIKKRNKKAMNINKKDETEIIPESPGIKNRPLAISNEEKTRREKESRQIQQNERNVDLRIDINGDTVTRRGILVHDRNTSNPKVQSIENWKKDIEEHKKLNGKKKNRTKIPAEERTKK